MHGGVRVARDDACFGFFLFTSSAGGAAVPDESPNALATKLERHLSTGSDDHIPIVSLSTINILIHGSMRKLPIWCVLHRCAPSPTMFFCCVPPSICIGLIQRQLLSRSFSHEMTITGTRAESEPPVSCIALVMLLREIS